MLVSFSAYSSTLKMDATISSETPVDFNRLQGAISQQTELFIEVLFVSCTNNTRERERECRVAFSFDGTLRTKCHRQGFRHVPTHKQVEQGGCSMI
jgi:hypothetical protein